MKFPKMPFLSYHEIAQYSLFLNMLKNSYFFTVLERNKSIDSLCKQNKNASDIFPSRLFVDSEKNKRQMGKQSSHNPISKDFAQNGF